MESFSLLVPEAAAISPPTVVCVTPVRNGRDALERFLPCAAEWADHIVVLDEGERSVRLAQRLLIPFGW
jgi:hypothetical protein